jgi:arsenate reductase
MTAHWAVEDPAVVQGTEADKWVGFRHAFKILDTRIKLLLSLPISSLDNIRLQRKIDEIGKMKPSTDDSAA